MFARARTQLLTATLGAVIMIAPSSTFGQTLDLSPEANFEQTCVVRPGPEPEPNAFWKTWDGVSAPPDAEDMLQSAMLYESGSQDVVRDRALAVRLLRYLASSDYPQAGDANVQLSKILLNQDSDYYDLEEGLGILRDRARQGDTAAISELGVMYALGNLVPQDEVLGESYLKQAAAAQDISAVYRLAQLYSRRADLAPQPDAASIYFQLSLSMRYQRLVAGDCTQLLRLGTTYADEGSAFYDPAKAIAWFNAAFRIGDPQAAEALGDAYINGEGVEIDDVKALTFFEFAADHGRTTAMLRASELLLNKRSKESTERARELLERAARAGEANTYETLAQLAAGRFGGEPDFAAELRYLREGASLPGASASLLAALGKAFEGGGGLPADPVEAFAAYSRAAVLGDAGAYLSMYELTSDGRVKVNSNPISYVRAAANLGSESAMAELSKAYACGTNVQQSELLARRWSDRAAAVGDSGTLISMGRRALVDGDAGKEQYFRDVRRAARSGDLKSQILLSEAYRNGIGTVVDETAATQWRNFALSDKVLRDEALLELARLNLSGDVVGPVQVSAALEYLNQAGEDNPAVAYELGKIYVDGIGGTPRDKLLGTRHLVDAAQHGYISAMLRLAEMDLTAEQAGGKNSESWLEQAARSNNMAALLLQADKTQDAEQHRALLDRAISLGSCDAKELVSLAAALMENGSYAQEPAKLLGKALQLDSDDPGTLLKLANYITSGVLRARDDTHLVDLLHRAALGGEPEAMRQLANFYLRGQVVEKNPIEARAWLTSAAVKGDEDAISDLVNLVNEPGSTDAAIDSIIADLQQAAGANSVVATGLVSSFLSEAARMDDRYQSVALEWVTKAAKGGDASAMMVLSNAYALGIGVTQSLEESARWLEAAAKAGNVDAYEKLAVVLELGLGVNQDSEQAEVWLKRAAEVKEN